MSKQRHTRRAPCPLCGGYDELRRGKGERCHGWTDGIWTHCSRDEFAGDLGQEEFGTYCHKMEGDCRCGVEHGSRPVPISTGYTARRHAKPIAADVTAPPVVYDYGDFQVVRWGNGPGKVIKQRRPDGRGGFIWNLDGVTPHLYHRDELQAAEAGAIVFVNEGEKGAEACLAHNLLATCSPMGAGHWRPEYAEDLRDKRVIIIADHDQAGRAHAATVAASLDGIALSTWIVEFTDLPEKSDAFDFFAAGGTVEELYRRALCAATPGATAPPCDGCAKRDAYADTLIAERDEARAVAEDGRRDRIAVMNLCASAELDHSFKPAAIATYLAAKHLHHFRGAEQAPVDLYWNTMTELTGLTDHEAIHRAVFGLAAGGFWTVADVPCLLNKPDKYGDPVEAKRYTVQFLPDADGAMPSLAERARRLCHTEAPEIRRRRRGKKQADNTPHAGHAPAPFIRRHVLEDECTADGEIFRRLVRSTKTITPAVEPLPFDRPLTATALLALPAGWGVLPR